jgi:hypothetical protein
MGNITDKISKEQFDIAYDNHLPSNWIKLAYKYFSKNTEKKDFGVKNTIVYVLLFFFLIGLFGTIFGLPAAIIGIATVTYTIILSALVLYLFSAVILNNLRISKIRKELGITKEEYATLVSVYYG